MKLREAAALEAELESLKGATDGLLDPALVDDYSKRIEELRNAALVSHISCSWLKAKLSFQRLQSHAFGIIIHYVHFHMI